MLVLKVKDHNSSIFGMGANIASAMAYVLPAALAFLPYIGYFAWIVPVVIFTMEKYSRFVRLCCAQAVVLSLIRLTTDVVFDAISAVAREVAYFNQTPEFTGFWSISGDAGGGAAVVKLIFALLLVLIGLFCAYKAFKWRFFALPLVADTCADVTDKFKN